MSHMENGTVVVDAVDITQINYSEYGILFNLSGEGIDTGNTNYSSGDGWYDVDTSIPLLDTLGSLGYTWSEKQPFVAKEMERHLHTQEAQIPIDQPIVLCLAKAGEEAPKADDVIAVIIRPGYVFVLNRGIWHSASHGQLRDGKYHWMALVEENEPTVWMDVEGGPLYVRVVT